MPKIIKKTFKARWNTQTNLIELGEAVSDLEQRTVSLDERDLSKSITDVATEVAAYNQKMIKMAEKVHKHNPGEFTVNQEVIVDDSTESTAPTAEPIQ